MSDSPSWPLISQPLTPLVSPSKGQNHKGSPQVYPPHLLLHSSTQGGVPPHQQGPGAGPHAQTLLFALPREAWASAGHLGEARISGYGLNNCPHSSPCLPLHCQGPSSSIGGGTRCLLTFIPRAQARVLWEAQAVWGGAGSSRTGAGTRGGGAWTILLSPTTAPELCIQLLS